MAGEQVEMALEAVEADQSAQGTGSGWWAWLEPRLERATEWLNPILVKEARQAMKSRQFSITFTLVLVFGLLWSFIGVSMQMPNIYYVPGGQNLLAGYIIILAVPLLLVVPFAAFRSLSGEREDGTYELLSITSLSARRIVSGKLGSAVLQMIVYLSAIGPCIAFTYLLRGVDIVTIVVLLLLTVLMSLMLSLVGMCMASASRSRHWQMMLSVLMILACLFATIVWMYFIAVVTFDGGGIESSWYRYPEFWAAFASFYISYFWILFVATEGLNSFASENRSSRIRVALMVQLGLFFGWVYYAGTQFEGNFETEFAYIMMLLATGHWMIYGTLMSGEHSKLPPRVERQLPRTWLGRAATAWFWPGPNTGYIFTMTLFGLFLAATTIALGQVGFNIIELMIWSLLIWGYMATFLALGRWLLIPARRLVPRGFALPFIINILILLLAVVVPLTIEAFTRGARYGMQYSFLQLTNWQWTFFEAMAMSRGRQAEIPLIAATVFVAGLVCYLIQLDASRHVFNRVRPRAIPARVAEDMAEHPKG